MKILIASLLSAMVLAACGAPNHGAVLGKRYEPSYTTIGSQCMAYTTSGRCRYSTPVYNTYPAEYEFKLKTSKHSGWTDVDPISYQRYGIG